MSEEKPPHGRMVQEFLRDWEFYVFEVFLVVFTVWLWVNLILALSEAGKFPRG